MNEITMNIIIIILIICLFIIDYYHKQYRIKISKKNFTYRNSHSFYDDTDYTKYKPYKEVYTYKYLIAFLTIILVINFISEPKSFFKLLILLFQ